MRDPERRVKIEADLAGPPLPRGLAYLWTTFLRLSRRRGSGGFGASPITWEALDAFQRLSGMRLAPWEIEVIEALDDTWRSAG